MAVMNNVTVPLPDVTRAWEPDVRRFILSSSLLYDQDSRLDATAYAEDATRILAELKACSLPQETIGALCGMIWHPVQNQARSNFKRIYTDAEHGVPFVSSRSMFGLPLRPERFLSRLMSKLPDLMVPKGWLLLSRSGTVGNVLYVNDSLARCAISDHAIRIEPKGTEAGYLYAFLASRYGQTLIAKGTYGSTVDELEPKHIAGIPVPLLPESQRLRIHNQIITAYELRDQANELIATAETELHSLLGVPPFKDDDVEYVGGKRKPRAFLISSSEIATRFDATNHVPVARSAVHKLARGRYKLLPLGDLVGKNNIDVPPRFIRIYVEQKHGIPLLQGSQLPLMRPYGLKYISTTLTKNIERWVIGKGWVLVTCSGTIGRVGICSMHQDGWAASQHILRIKPSTTIDPGFLAAFLATPFGQHQMNTKIYGGVVDELTAEDMAHVMVPNVPLNEQRLIGELVLQAYELRDEANELEDQAIEELEDAIAGKDERENDRDAETARKRLIEIKDARQRLVQGKELRDRLARLEM
jgi:type I restriction enzyme S subunit